MCCFIKLNVPFCFSFVVEVYWNWCVAGISLLQNNGFKSLPFEIYCAKRSDFTKKKKKRKNEQLPPSVFFSLKFLKFDNRSSSIFADRSCLETSQDSAKRNDSHHGTSNIVIMVRLVHVCVEYYRKFSVSWTRTVCRSVCTLVNVLYACLYDCSSGVYKVQRALY